MKGSLVSLKKSDWFRFLSPTSFSGTPFFIVFSISVRITGFFSVISPGCAKLLVNMYVKGNGRRAAGWALEGHAKKCQESFVVKEIERKFTASQRCLEYLNH